MDATSPQVLEQLIAFAGDTAAADKVKDKPSVRNSSPASLAGIWASKCTGICAVCKLLLHVILYVHMSSRMCDHLPWWVIIMTISKIAHQK